MCSLTAVPPARRRLRKGDLEWGTRELEAAICVAAPHRVAVGHVRVAPAGLVDDGGVERLGVVWTQEPPRLARGESGVEQRLVALAFDQLSGATSLPDRFADASQPATRTAVL